MMMWDIILPKDNEEEFFLMAQKLGYKGLIFLVDKLPNKNNEQTKKISEKLNISYTYALTQKTGKTFSIIKTTANVRHTIEKIRPNIIYGVEYHTEKDFMKQRNSQLNHIIAKIMKNRHVAYGVPVSKLFEENILKILPRIKQNIELCTKYQAKIVAASFAEFPHQMNAPLDIIGCLVETFGMNSGDAKKAVDNVENLVKNM